MDFYIIVVGLNVLNFLYRNNAYVISGFYHYPVLFLTAGPALFLKGNKSASVGFSAVPSIFAWLR